MCIRDSSGTDPISGEFNGLPDGTILTLGGVNAIVDYEGGDGNDLTLLTAEDGSAIVDEGTLYVFGTGLDDKIDVNRQKNSGDDDDNDDDRDDDDDDRDDDDRDDHDRDDHDGGGGCKRRRAAGGCKRPCLLPRHGAAPGQPEPAVPAPAAGAPLTALETGVFSP